MGYRIKIWDKRFNKLIESKEELSEIEILEEERIDQLWEKDEDFDYDKESIYQSTEWYPVSPASALFKALEILENTEHISLTIERMEDKPF